MRAQCTEENPLWTRPFAARYLGVSVETIARLMSAGTLRYTYPFPDNERDVRLFREDVIAYRAYILGQATMLASLQRQNAHVRTLTDDSAQPIVTFTPSTITSP